ncbi:hypothetical protein HYALB_00007863 [Hymenoscyphus albidus]|uniref:Uncharacterized protein n=1 Tax=Hymenoscyphus albidus TaxID=595503 RepID=A0A9N9LIK6_9HELO|nr:hypothetical protein HYALB_00007863 [Hymenoscyphus albidus]
MGYVQVSTPDTKAPASNHPNETLEQFLHRVLGKDHLFQGWFGENSVTVEGRLTINADGKTYIYDPALTPKEEKYRVQKRHQKKESKPARVYRDFRQRVNNGPVSVHVHGIHRRGQCGVPGAKAMKRLLDKEKEMMEKEANMENGKKEDEDGDVEMAVEAVKVLEKAQKKFKREDTPALSKMDVDCGKNS